MRIKVYFSQRLWQFNFVWAFTPDLILSSYSQYDSESREIGMNNRLRWTIRPGRDLFVVWNHGWKRPVGTRGNWSLDPVGDSLVVKLQNALKSYNKGNLKTAINGLNAFINEVEAQSGKKITVAQANFLIDWAEDIIYAIEEEMGLH